MKNIFGKENYYLEIQNHGMPEEAKVTEGLVRLSEECGIDLVATNDVHYLSKSHAEYQDILMCIQTNDVVTNERALSFSTNEYYYKSTAEMENLFSAYKGAIENTVKIASMCSFDFDFSKIYLPRYDIPSGFTATTYLKRLTLDGLRRRIASGDIKEPDNSYLDRIDSELAVIDTMGYSEYFLIVWDFVNYAKSKKIPVGPGRGSGGSSLVAYLIGITDIDPVKYGLIFESFLNIDRVSMPDFDIDFADNRRDEVIEYVKQKYGDDHVSQIITFGTLSARAVVRDVGRALGMAYADIDRIAKLIPRELNISLKDAMSRRELSELYSSDAKIKRLIDVSLFLEGMPRHASTHAAGVVITDKPVYEYVPLASNGGNMLTEFDMDTVAELGLLKFDFLGIRYLTVIAETEKMIRRRDPSFDIEKIPLDDEKTYSLICKANTDGVFQLNKTIKPMLPTIHPDCFEDIIATVALDRPGPINAGSVTSYAEGKKHPENIKYLDDKLIPILRSTYGCLIYTEQITKIFRELAGYPFSKADNVRRAIKKKKAGVFEAERERFIKGAVENGVSEEAAKKIFSDIEGFSEYAFNQSHATAYGLLAYRTAYLKAHYLKEYYSALISTESNVYPFISELKRNGIKVLNPDVNFSYKGFSVEDDAIRFGLLSISNVGRPLVEYIINEREFAGKFTSFDDFITRTEGADLTRKQYEMLVKAGALDSLGINRNAALALTEKVAEFRASAAGRSNGQMDLLSMIDEDSVHSRFNIPDVREMPMTDLLAFEKESLGIYISGSILGNYSGHIAKLAPSRIGDIVSSFDETSEGGAVFRDGDRVTVAGNVEKINNKKTKRGDPMAFVTIEDVTGGIECIVFANLLSRSGYLLTLHNAVAVSGTVSVKDDEVSILATKIEQLRENSDFSSESEKTVYIKIDDVGTETYNAVRDALLCKSGGASVVFYLKDKNKYVRENGLSAATSEEHIERIKKIVGDDAVAVK